MAGLAPSKLSQKYHSQARRVQSCMEKSRSRCSSFPYCFFFSLTGSSTHWVGGLRHRAITKSMHNQGIPPASATPWPWRILTMIEPWSACLRQTRLILDTITKYCRNTKNSTAWRAVLINRGVLRRRSRDPMGFLGLGWINQVFPRSAVCLFRPGPKSRYSEGSQLLVFSFVSEANLWALTIPSVGMGRKRRKKLLLSTLPLKGQSWEWNVVFPCFTVPRTVHCATFHRPLGGTGGGWKLSLLNGLWQNNEKSRM